MVRYNRVRGGGTHMEEEGGGGGVEGGAHHQGVTATPAVVEADLGTW